MHSYIIYEQKTIIQLLKVEKYFWHDLWRDANNSLVENWSLEGHIDGDKALTGFVTVKKANALFTSVTLNKFNQDKSGPYMFQTIREFFSPVVWSDMRINKDHVFYKRNKT